MDIFELRDLIKDERGNYYIAVKISGKELTLVNAFVELSFKTTLKFNDDFKKEFENYEHQFMGKIPMDALRHNYMYLLNKKIPGNIYSLDEVTKEYDVSFIDTMEFYRNPKIK